MNESSISSHLHHIALTQNRYRNFVLRSILHTAAYNHQGWKCNSMCSLIALFPRIKQRNISPIPGNGKPSIHKCWYPESNSVRYHLAHRYIKLLYLWSFLPSHCFSCSFCNIPKLYLLLLTFSSSHKYYKKQINYSYITIYIFIGISYIYYTRATVQPVVPVCFVQLAKKPQVVFPSKVLRVYEISGEQLCSCLPPMLYLESTTAH